VVTQHLGKSESIKSADGRPLARGQYKVTLASSSPDTGAPLTAIPQGASVIAAKTYFLGGPNDAMYLTRLKEFHDKLKAKADTELQELRQLQSMLEGQLRSTDEQFAALSTGKVTAPKKLKWNEFHAKWRKLAENISQHYPRWTAPGVRNEYFHASLYEMTLLAARSLEKLHQAQTDRIQGRAPKPGDLPADQAGAAAQTLVNALKTKIDATAALPPTPGGLPQKEAP
jgi:hypothetical protein